MEQELIETHREPRVWGISPRQLRDAIGFGELTHMPPGNAVIAPRGYAAGGTGSRRLGSDCGAG
ncbi:hypothetical protein CRG98_019545 [Punica granatum]|uniref:Uncharacterized protein n=1 Tax=Punica granatum TaxID=22663 RepID=A0A2I0JW11_PUNGR|nr:hypothetical protein CRG98_019545 [Punica granatum]